VAINARRVVILSNADLVKKLSFNLVDAESLKERLNVGRQQATMKKRECLCVIDPARSSNLAEPINARESAVKPIKEMTPRVTISASKSAEKLSIVAIIPALISAIWVTVNSAPF